MTSASTEKAFAVVEFEEEDSLKIIPTKWIVDDCAKYPTKCSEKALKKLVKSCVDAESSWKSLKMQIYCKTNSFMKAEKLLALVKDASDGELDPSGTENGQSEKSLGKRQIKMPSRYASDEESPRKSTTLKPEKGSIMKAKKKLKDTSDVQSDSSESNDASFSSRKRRISALYADGKMPSRKSVTHRTDPLHYYQEMLNEGADSSFDEKDYIAHASYQKRRKMLSRFNRQQMDGSSSDEELYGTRKMRKKFSTSPAMLSSIHKLKKDLEFKELKQLMMELLNVQEKTFLKVKDVEERQKRLQAELRKIREVILKPNDMVEVPHLPDDLILPIFTDSELENLNERLGNDKELQTRFVHFLFHTSYGKNISTFMTACLKRVMTQNVAQLYSRLGRKGKKSFTALANLYAAIIGAAALKFPDGTTDEFSERLGRTLASSGDWEGRNRPPITITVVKQATTEDENC
ncbi:uncharacterized protein LOC129229931 isoform X2 [Uloborus diversus]|uniref:uncharacterized protein LOC129229931 isoform X2 n=1 Tax=Uloborus diversus TaxID=327109 RepID=UPI0024092E3C|nr:uncharacterized protein LOC129229931 isoform X2 [Uloborus diversus]